MWKNYSCPSVPNWCAQALLEGGGWDGSVLPSAEVLLGSPADRPDTAESCQAQHVGCCVSKHTQWLSVILAD